MFVILRGAVCCRSVLSWRGAQSNYTGGGGGGGCFGAGCTVAVVCGDRAVATRVTKVVAGDVVAVEGGHARVLCAVRVRVPTTEPLVAVAGGPTLTPGHPVKVDGAWRPAAAVSSVSMTTTRGADVFNFVLDSVHVLLVNGMPCATLGHNLSGPCVAHPFYGTERSVRALAAIPGWNRGAIAVKVLRDAAGHATGFAPAGDANEACRV